MSEQKTKVPVLTKSLVSGTSEFSIPLEPSEKPYTIELLGYGARIKRTIDASTRELIAGLAGITPDTLIFDDSIAEKVLNAGKAKGLTAFEIFWQFGVFEEATSKAIFKTGVPKEFAKPSIREVKAVKGTFEVKDNKTGEMVKRDTVKLEVLPLVSENSNEEVKSNANVVLDEVD